MRKVLLFCLALLLLLPACAKRETAEEYTNLTTNMGTFSIGDSIYEVTGLGLRRYRGDSDTATNRFCTDPLCDHRGRDGVCPDCEKLYEKRYATDGRRIYFNSPSHLPDSRGETNTDRFQIYSFEQDGSGMTLLASFDGSSRAQPNLRCCGGYLYFAQGFYTGDEAADDKYRDQTVRFMRVSTEGGKIEQALPGDYDPFDRLFVDDEHFYIVHGGRDSGSSLDILDREGNALLTEVMPEGHAVWSVQIYRGKTYVLCADVTETVHYGTDTEIASLSLYRIDGTEFTRLVGGIGSDREPVYADGAVWFSPAGHVYHGTVDMPSGIGGETEPYDEISRSDGSLVRYDLTTGKTASWKSETDGEEITFLGLSCGYAIARIKNTGNEENTSGIWKLVLNDDGSVTAAGTIDTAE